MDYKIRRGRRGEGHDAISDADRYEGPICTGICTAGGAPGPGGAGRRLLPPTVLKYFVVNRTKKKTLLVSHPAERTELHAEPC